MTGPGGSSTGPAESSGDKLESDRLISRALAGEVASGSQIFTPERLLREGAQVAQQAVIDVIPTERAKQKKSERTDMMMVASAPIRNSRGDVVDALCGGVLLNGNNALVERIKKIVFKGVQFEGKDIQRPYSRMTSGSPPMSRWHGSPPAIKLLHLLHISYNCKQSSGNEYTRNAKAPHHLRDGALSFKFPAAIYSPT